MKAVHPDSGGPLEWLEGSVHVTRAGHLLLAPDSEGSPVPADGVAPALDNQPAGTVAGSMRHAADPAKTDLGLVSLLMGMLGLVTPWLPIRGVVTAPQATLWLPFLGVVFAPLAVILGILAGARFTKSSMNKKKMATAGLALGAFYLLLLTGAFLFVLITST